MSAWYGKSFAFKALHRDAEADDAFAKAKDLGLNGSYSSVTKILGLIEMRRIINVSL